MLRLEEEIEYWEGQEYLAYDALSQTEKNQLAEAYWQRGQLLAAKSPEYAIADYSRSLELNPRVANVWYHRSQLYKRLGEHARGDADQIMTLLYDADQLMVKLAVGPVQERDKLKARELYHALVRNTLNSALLLYGNLKLLLLGEKRLHMFLYQIEMFKPGDRIDQVCIGAMAQCYLRNYAATSIDLFRVKDLSCWLHRDLFELLCNRCCWPAQSLPDHASQTEWGELKKVLLEMMENLADKTVLVNAALQALCKSTILGRVFHMQRGIFPPSISSGSLQKIAQLLNENPGILLEGQLSGDTKAALQAEQDRHPNFRYLLENDHPQLYAMIKSHIKTASHHAGLFANNMKAGVETLAMRYAHHR